MATRTQKLMAAARVNAPRREKRAAMERKLEELTRRMWHADVAPGFDYQHAVRRLVDPFHYSYEQLADFLRYKSKSSVARILDGVVEPSHSRGEALYILYVETFGEKPPFKKLQIGNNK